MNPEKLLFPQSSPTSLYPKVIPNRILNPWQQNFDQRQVRKYFHVKAEYILETWTKRIQVLRYDIRLAQIDNQLFQFISLYSFKKFVIQKLVKLRIRFLIVFRQDSFDILLGLVLQLGIKTSMSHDFCKVLERDSK